MGRTKVAPREVVFVNQTGCSGQCGPILEINNGIPLECKGWTKMESALLRERMLVDNQLFASGFVTRVERSSLGNSLRMKKSGIDVGPIRTQDSGAPAVNECKVMFDGITVKDFEKTFYVVNASKNLQICTKDFIGTKWQDFIGGAISDYEADAFANTDLATIIIAAIIEKVKAFVPEFMLLAACGSPVDNRHGDDGIFAKAFYAAMNQYFHTISYDMSLVDSTYPLTYINAIVGGAHYDSAPSDFSTANQYLLDFVAWLNGHVVNGAALLTATIDLTTSKMTVVSNFVTKDIDLRIVLNDGATVDWTCKQAKVDELVYTLYEKSMLINDVPLLFEYEPINSTNFSQLFMDYKNQYFTYLHNNGFSDIAPSEVFIGIDPLLMIQRTQEISNEVISGNGNTNFMDIVGLQLSQFIPINALTGSGLFFMTTKGNLLMLDDGSNFMNTIDNMGRISIKESCNGAPGMVDIFGGVPPIGSSVDAWGLFASNLLGSRFVLENKLADREPCEAAKLNIVCYDADVKNNCQVVETCQVESTVTSTIEYDDLADTTTITVAIESFGANGTLAYDLDWALSDGTGSEGVTTPNFAITLPGKQTAAGLRLTITGTVTSSGADNCVGYITHSNQFGIGDGVTLCTGTITNDQNTNSVTTGLSLAYDIDGGTESIALSNSALSFNTPSDYPAIELEIEVLLNGTNATLSKSGTNVTFSMSDIPSFISNITLISAATTNQTTVLLMDCNG